MLGKLTKIQIQAILILSLTKLWLIKLLKHHKMVNECENSSNSSLNWDFSGKPGQYRQQMYKNDASRELLKNLKFKFDNPARIKLI
jgi:hypothetical protein